MASRKPGLARFGIVAIGALTLAAGHARAQTCVGDCNGDGQVSINELIKGVNIALDRAPLTDCPVFDADGNGSVAVNELITAVQRALAGCQCGPQLGVGYAALARGDLRSAATSFGAAAAACPADATARFLAAMSQGPAKVLDSSEAHDLAARAGIIIEGDSADVCAIHATYPIEILPSSPRTSEYLDAIRRLVRPDLEHAVAELAALTPDATIHLAISALPPCVRARLDIDITSLEIDRGDLLVARAGLETGLALLDLVDGYGSDA